MALLKSSHTTPMYPPLHQSVKYNSYLSTSDYIR